MYRVHTVERLALLEVVHCERVAGGGRVSEVL
jgi:hypothetical protein